MISKYKEVLRILSRVMSMSQQDISSHFSWLKHPEWSAQVAEASVVLLSLKLGNNENQDPKRNTYLYIKLRS